MAYLAHEKVSNLGGVFKQFAVIHTLYSPTNLELFYTNKMVPGVPVRVKNKSGSSFIKINPICLATILDPPC